MKLAIRERLPEFVAVDVGGGDVDEVFELPALFGELEDLLHAVVVDIEGYLQGGIKVDAGGAVDDDVAGVSDPESVCGGEAKAGLEEIAVDWDDLFGDEGVEVVPFE